ncbi:type VII secretion protein EccB [Nocardia sp. CDC159]|uniref:Type VII secretion protein EccB n=1 Tax=Nocardia pulmonis TaxID=2951408 RepID=A0A9X2E881_9NOCA|nr:MULTISPECIES: type VII secretion protein EccB [Nocardia]MCM6776099.1 type VII secretion protein EccB [Nocardia pulmonis]MCM6788574.1 type VII secretion protein EccB [Nocardia sp. CDC159]
MPAQLTTRQQVNGYRFLLRRLDHALVRRDVRMLHDPMRSQTRSLVVGAILGLLVVAGAAILAFLRPQGAIGDAKIVMGKDSGALYVVVADKAGNTTLHPVLNLASARLISGSSEGPKSVKDNKLGSMPRGPMLGIPGAPAALPGSGQGKRSDWTLCEAVKLSATGRLTPGAGTTTTIASGRPALSERIRVAGPGEAVLVRHADKTYLIYEGKRAEVDAGNSVVARTLGLATHPPRPAGTALLDAATAVPPLTPPAIAQAGSPGPGRLSNVPVGGVISVDGLGQPDLYVVLADGVQRIAPFTAQLIRNADSQGMSEIKSVPPDALDGVRVVEHLQVEHFPTQIPKIISGEDAPVACVTWGKNVGAPAKKETLADDPADRAVVSLLVGSRLPIPESAKPVELATATGDGNHVDNVYVRPSTGEFVQTTGMDPSSVRRDGLFYIGDNGIRYGIPDVATAQILGLKEAPRLAPWAIVGQLVPGPTLSPDAALVSYDTLPQTR